MSEGVVAISNQKRFEQYEKEIGDINTTGIRVRGLKSEEQLERLLNEKFYNPYDVLLLQSMATDEEIKKQYRNFSVVLHPDKCKDPRAKDAWHMIQQAHKTLADPDKRKVYLRIMKEAKDRTDFERDKQNKKRIKNGQPPLPQDTFQSQYQEMCHKIFKEIDDKKNHLVKLQQSNFSRKMDELQTKRMVEQYRILTEDEWERSRQKRVSNWRDFSKKKYVIGTKRSDGGIRPPPVIPENRPEYTKIETQKKNL